MRKYFFLSAKYVTSVFPALDLAEIAPVSAFFRLATHFSPAGDGLFSAEEYRSPAAGHSSMYSTELLSPIRARVESGKCCVQDRQ